MKWRFSAFFSTIRLSTCRASTRTQHRSILKAFHPIISDRNDLETEREKISASGGKIGSTDAFHPVLPDGAENPNFG
jgi:hypothetical protein